MIERKNQKNNILLFLVSHFTHENIEDKDYI